MSALPFAVGVSVDPTRGLACFRLNGVAEPALLRSRLSEAGGYTVVLEEARPTCPVGLVAHKTNDPWAGAAGLDVVVISLDGADATVSFGLPVAKQQPQWAEGLPWLIVVNPKGKTVYQGSDPAAAIAATRR